MKAAHPRLGVPEINQPRFTSCHRVRKPSHPTRVLRGGRLCTRGSHLALRDSHGFAVELSTVVGCGGRVVVGRGVGGHVGCASKGALRAAAVGLTHWKRARQRKGARAVLGYGCGSSLIAWVVGAGRWTVGPQVGVIVLRCAMAFRRYAGTDTCSRNSKPARPARRRCAASSLRLVRWVCDGIVGVGCCGRLCALRVAVLCLAETVAILHGARHSTEPHARPIARPPARGPAASAFRMVR